MKKTGTVILCAISGVLLLLAGTISALWPSPETALRAFYDRTHVPEETITDPLVVVGDRVVPVVISEVRNKSMPNRTYAIMFLGKGRYREALPTLLRILTDETESDIVRGMALDAISNIDQAEGKRRAQRYAESEGYLGVKAASLQRGFSPYGPRRTRFQALVGWLDP